ncbi:MAG: hypothetical protein LBK68_01765 [Candidatus Margulisbacteria bacterium]|jgi:hypothetical protein|nr:hypothetical protein [Candidatus Margulisiibacteriota bacterium]
MATREYLKNEIDVLPAPALDTAQEFIAYLLHRYSVKTNNSGSSASAAAVFRKQMKDSQKLASAAGLTRAEVKKSIRAVRQKNEK